MSRVPPPVLGFNNNVRHRGRIFHIQTEDSGVRFARIVTHLFADGGRIIKTTKTDYTEHLEKSDVARTVRALMKEQHRAMFAALRAGDLDGLLERAIGPLSDTPPAARASRRPESVRPPRSAAPSERPRRNRSPLSNPALRGVAQSVSPPTADAFDFEISGLDKLPMAAPRSPSTRPPRKSNPTRRSARPP
ncbi:MAG TPA: hypothetical protein VGK73_26470, partial [Polyangiaceae bacterium]